MKVSVPFPLSNTSHKCCGRINAPHGGTRIPYMVHNMSGHKNACTENASLLPAFVRICMLDIANIAIIFELCGILPGVFFRNLFSIAYSQYRNHSLSMNATVLVWPRPPKVYSLQCESVLWHHLQSKVGGLSQFAFVLQIGRGR